MGPEGTQNVAPPKPALLAGEGGVQVPLGRRSPAVRGDRIISPPNISFIIFDIVLPEIHHQLLLKGHLPVMFFLPGNVVQQGRHVRLTDAEGGITFLLGKLPPSRPFCVNPTGGIRLQFFHSLCNGNGGSELD